MDLKVVGKCLFDNMRQQLEIVCKEVDEIAKHDSIKYIERKVQNAGENVMKLCSKFGKVLALPKEDQVQVVALPEEDLVIDEAEDEVDEQDYDDALRELIGSDEVPGYTTDKPYSTDSEETDSEETDFEISSCECFSCTSSAFYGSSAFMPIPTDLTSPTSIWNDELTAMENYLFPNQDFSSYYNGSESPSYVRALQNEIADVMKWHSDYLASQIDSFGNCSSSIGSSTESSGSSDNEICETTDLDEDAKSLSDQFELEETCVVVDAPHHDVSFEAQKQHSYKIDSFGNCSSSIGSSTESSGSSDNEICETTDLDEEAKSLSDQLELEICETIDLDEEAKSLSDQFELEETCVVVDAPHHDVSCVAQKQHSYKEKILNALSSKKRLEREYKELANLHSENAAKCFQGTTLPKVLLRESQTVHLSNSEWELL